MHEIRSSVSEVTPVDDFLILCLTLSDFNSESKSCKHCRLTFSSASSSSSRSRFNLLGELSFSPSLDSLSASFSSSSSSTLKKFSISHSTEFPLELEAPDTSAVCTSFSLFSSVILVGLGVVAPSSLTSLD